MTSISQAHSIVCLALIGAVVVSPAATAESTTNGPNDSNQRFDALKQEIEKQKAELDFLKRELALQRAQVNTLSREVHSPMGVQRARGTVPVTSDTSQTASTSDQIDPQSIAQVTSTPPTIEQVNGRESGIRSGNAASEQKESAPPQVAQIFEQPGVLTAKNHWVIEPSLQYGYSSNNRVALVGYTVIPALLIGLIDVREVKRNTTAAALSVRYGVSNRLEVEAKVPYIYRSDDTVSRELFTGTATDRIFSTSGKSIGDVEIGARYQLNDGGADKPYFISTLRYKSRTGKDPFQVVTDCVTRCVGNATGSGLPIDLPTGSGFNSIQPGLTWLFPSDPAVFFGSFSYTYNFGRSNLSRQVLNSEREFLGSIKPGNVFGTNFGLGIGLNEKSSLSLGIDLNSIGRTRQNGLTLPGSVRTQLATLLFGYSYRLNERMTLSVSAGAGLTRDTPDLTLNLKLPISF